MPNNKFLMREGDWDMSQSPPKRLLQAVLLEDRPGRPKLKKLTSYFFEVLKMREIMIRFGKVMIFFRIVYPTKLLDLGETIRRFFWWRLQYLKERWYRKTFRVTDEQVHERLEKKAQQAVTITITEKKPE